MGEAAFGGGEPSEFAHRIWPAHPRHLARIRSEVRRWLGPLALAGDNEDDLVLAVSEAVSNSVEHAYGPATLDGTVELTFGRNPMRCALRWLITASGGFRPVNRLGAVVESRSCSGSSPSS